MKELLWKYNVNNILLPIGYNAATLKRAVAEKLKVNASAIAEVSLTKTSVDARKKPRLYHSVNVVVTLKYQLPDEARNGVTPYVRKINDTFIEEKLNATYRPIIVGSGPSGMFCALMLAKKGLCPIVIEQGSEISERISIVDRFWSEGQLSTHCNVQYGEGGAGTFSDGKLNSGISDELCGEVIKQFVAYGAPKEILTEAKPHVGTDKLREVVAAIRNEIIRLGGEYCFDSRFEDLKSSDGILTVTVCAKDKNYTLITDTLVLGIGHSAKSTVELLEKRGAEIQAKPFSIGVRIEHKQRWLDTRQYGEENLHFGLPAADYKLAITTAEERGVYTFCMCPGGKVVASSSEESTVVTNGMSNFARDEENCNSAILVTVTPKDYCGIYGGFDMQKDIEASAYNVGKNYAAPIQRVEDYLLNRPTTRLGSVTPSYRPTVCLTNIRAILPPFIGDAIAEAIPLMDKKLKGFAAPDAVLTGVETRSSSPVRIVRGANRQCAIPNVYPIGEGAGYAGGIMSSAVDGIKTALQIVESLRK